jgi:hypothetical protein
VATVFEAIDTLRNRQSSIVRTLDAAKIPYALSGSNATFVWIESVEESAVRFYRNVEFIIRRSNLNSVIEALSSIGLIPDQKADRIVFQDKPNRREHWSDRALFSGEEIVSNLCFVPDTDPHVIINGVRVLPLQTLAKFQLERWTLDDNVDLRDMIDVGLIDANWPAKFRPELANRLQHLLDTPDG